MTREATEQEVDSLSFEALVDAYFEALHESARYSHAFRSQFRFKPLIGGVFGHGGFLLGSWWTVRGGLDRVEYFLADQETHFVFARSESKAETLANGRSFIQRVSMARLKAEFQKHADNVRAFDDARRRELHEAIAARNAQPEEAGKVRSIPRRRQRIFDECDGKCHYCATPLTLDGKWHIEHKMPKALGGGNEPGNLVASCVPCNTKKRDTTDVEFKARLAEGSA